jgi:hypothetical protein
VVSDRDDRRWGTFPVTSSWNELADVALFELDMAVDVKEEEAKERERRANLRATALAKLSTEERELLGL